MADTSNLTTFLGDVADAIREKKGTELPIPAADFDTEIRSITTGSDTSDATATADDILYPKTAYVDGERITGSIVTERLPSSLTLVDEEKDITSANNNILDYFVLDDEEFVISSSANTNMSSIVVQNSVTQNTINISNIKSGCVLLSAKLFDLNVVGEIGIIAVLENVSSQIDYIAIISLNVNNLSVTSSYTKDVLTATNSFSNIIYNSIKDSFVVLLRTYRGSQYIHLYTIKCEKNNFTILSQYSQYVYRGSDSYYKNFLDGYWDSVGEKLVVNSYQYGSGGTDRDVSYLFTFSSNLTTVNCIVLNSGGKNTTPYQFLNEEYLINRNNQIYKINNSSISLYKTASNINISNKQVYDKIVTLNNCFYLYFSINASKIYVYKYDEGFNFTYEKEISWSINSTNAAYSYLMYCPKTIDNIIKYSELNKIKEIYATTNSPDFASLERNGIKYFNTSDSNISAGDVLENKIAYGKTIKIMGTMPNNGELNYDVSTSKQTIPEGYTSGGTIAASPLTDSEYDECLETTQQILGQSASL